MGKQSEQKYRWSVTLLVHDLTSTAASRLRKHKVHGASWYVQVPSDHSITGRSIWAKVEWHGYGTRRYIREQGKNILDFVEQLVGYQLRIDFTAEQVRGPSAHVWLQGAPDDMCKGCGLSASAMGSVLTPMGYHLGCRYAPGVDLGEEERRKQREGKPK